MRKCALSFICLLAALTLPATIARAVGTSYWTQGSEADFKAGTLESVVATNLGDMKLSRAVKTLLEEDPQVSAVLALAEGPDGVIYAGTGPNGVLLQIQGEKITPLATIPGSTSILSLLVGKNGQILLGTGGESGRVLKIAKPGDKPQVVFQAEGVQYVWALAQTPDGNIYAATGPTGQLFEIKPDGSKRVLVESGESNVLSLVSDGKDILFFGTDPHGLVYRVNRKTGESFVLYNAAEAEISALVLDKNGNLYAGTSEAKAEPPAPEQNPAGHEKGGRPEGSGLGVPIPSDRPKEPTPPPLPNPNPGQPDPIPKTSTLRTDAHERSLLRRRAVVCKSAETRRTFCLEPVQQYMWASTAIRPPRLGGPTFALDNNTAAPAMFAFAAEVVADNSDDGSLTHRPRPGPGNPAPGPNPNPGKPDPAPGPQTAPAPPDIRPPTVDTTAGAEPRAEGNAIYKIDADGFVTEIFRQPVLILSMVENNGTLLVATGGAEGQVFQVRPNDEETVVLAKVDAKQIMCLLSTHDGKIMMGTANVGSLASMSGGYATRGTFTSQVLDATQISRFGKLRMHGSLPAGTGLTVATRSGNVMEADEKTWSKWSDEMPAAEFMPVKSPSARFLQYRLTFTSPEGDHTPVVRDVSIAYQVPNLPPQIKAIKIANSAAAAAADALADVDATPRKFESSRRQTINWEASDPNSDTLTYSLYLRLIGEKEWILLKDKLIESTYEWDTRATADGRYQVKVVASDAMSNPPGMGKTAARVSDPVTVDNTPPVIGDVKSQQHGGEMQISLKVVDRTSTVASVDYSVDSSKDWQFVLPTDQIYDSPEETVSFSIANLKPGQHQIALRATDSKGNQAFENLFITITVEGNGK